MEKRQVTIGLIAVLLLAAVLRWYHFYTFPPGLWFDEAHHLNAAQAIALGNAPPQLYYPIKTGEPAIFWLTAVALKLGANHLAPRWVAAVASLLGILLLFAASRDILRRHYRFAGPLALWSAAVLATNYVYLFNSRMGWEPVLVTTIAIPAIWFFWRGLQDGRRRDFLWAGLALGASQYTGVIARSVPIVLFLVTVAWLFGRKDLSAGGERETGSRIRYPARSDYLSRFAGLLTTGAAAAVVYLPLARHFLHSQELFAQRLDTAATVGEWPANLARTLGGFVWLDEETLHRLTDRPVFDGPIAILLIAGAAIALWRWRQPVFGLWLVWIAGFLPGAMMSSPAPVFYRTLPAIPAAAVLSAVALAEGWQWARRRDPAWQWGFRAAACLILAASLFINSRDYFQRWANSPELFGFMDVGKWTAADAILRAGSEAALFVSMPVNVDPAVSYAIQTRGPALRAFDGQRCLVLREPEAEPLRYFSIAGYENRSLDRLMALFPQGSQAVDPIFGGSAPYFIEFSVPARSMVQIPGVLAEPVRFGSITLRGVALSHTTVAASAAVTVTLTWQATAPTDRNLTAFVHLLSPDAQDSAPLKAQHDGIPCDGSEPTTRWQAGEWIVDEHVLVLPPDVPGATYLLGVGLYETESLQPIPPAGEDLRLLWGEAVTREITVAPGSQ